MEKTSRFRFLNSKNAKTMISTAASGGLSIYAMLIGNWWFVAVAVLLTVFKDEVNITGRYVCIVVLVIACPAWPWEEKKKRIALHTEVLIQVLERNLVKKFFEREVL